MDKMDPSTFATRASLILTGLGFNKKTIHKKTKDMSGGWRMRVALAKALFVKPSLLLLDDPTAHLDLEACVWLEEYLKKWERTLVLVSHSMDFLNGVCSNMIDMRQKQLQYYGGNYDSYNKTRSENETNQMKAYTKQQEEIAHIKKFIASAGTYANLVRQAKSRQKKLDDRWGMQVGAKGGRFKLNKELNGFFLKSREDIDIPPEERPVVITLPEPPDLRFPGSLLSVEKASYRYSPKTPVVIQDINLTVGMGDRVGVLGLNGSGKSTLIKLLVGETRPTTGSVTTHPRLKLGYYSQHAVEDLKALGRDDPELTALSLLTRDVDGALNEGELRALLGELGLPGRIASDIPVTKLSGGQLVRCGLARLFWQRPHCLVLDEVTTHLDYETVTALRVALSQWDGAVVLVSHDRWFMRGAVEGNMDEGEDESEESDEAEEAPRRRVVYRLKGGEMSVLNNGVDQFEQIMEKRASKLLDA